MDDGKASSNQTYRCGATVIDAGLRQVLVDGEPARLGARAFDVLLALLERRERVVGKRELLDLAWPKLVVEENNLQVQIVALRKLLGPQAIATIPGRGYRFTLPVVAGATAPGSPTGQQSAAERAMPAPRGNLPAASPLFGRDAELREVEALVARHRVVSIVGAGGLGKTRLGLAAAGAAARNFRDGVWWIELATINDSAAVDTAVALALGLRAGDGAAPARGLCAALAGQQALLVFDNCEHLVDAVAGLVDQLGAAAPSVHVLVTSQEVLKCADERVFRLGTLAVPDTPRLDDALDFGAVALFVERASAAEPRFRLAVDNVAAVVDVCRRLDGVALAIELAAARVPLLGVHGLQSRLDRMFNVLTGTARIALRRHQTLRAALEWSHELLDDDERAVFRRLGVFAGAFTIELAQQVGVDDAIDVWRVLDLLGQLVDKSLVLAGDEAEPRYRLLEPTRAFALERLGASGETDAWLRRHAEAVLDALRTADERRWIAPCSEQDRRGHELGNLRAALDWAMRAGETRLAAELLAAAWNVWLVSGAEAEGRDRMRRLEPPPADWPPDLEARFWYAYAQLAHGMVGDEYLAAARRAVHGFRRLGNTDRLRDALLLEASICATRRAPVDAGDALDEAARLIGADAPLRLQAALAGARSMWHRRRNEFPACLAAARQQGELARRDGNAIGELLATISVANTHLYAGDYDAAAAAAEQALAGLARLGPRYAWFHASFALLQARALRGDPVDITPAVRADFEHFRGTGLAWPAVMALALQVARAGDFARAGLLAGWARAAFAGTQRHLRPVDLQMRAKLRELVDARHDDATLEAWQRAGERLTEEQVAAIAFEQAPLEGLLP